MSKSEERKEEEESKYDYFVSMERELASITSIITRAKLKLTPPPLPTHHPLHQSIFPSSIRNNDKYLRKWDIHLVISLLLEREDKKEEKKKRRTGATILRTHTEIDTKRDKRRKERERQCCV